MEEVKGWYKVASRPNCSRGCPWPSSTIFFGTAPAKVHTRKQVEDLLKDGSG